MPQDQVIATIPVEDVPVPPGGRRERKKAQLRQQIIDTAIQMFRERGYEATRIEDINERLDISRTTFFRYFPSKDAVLRDYVFEYRTGVLRAATAGDAPVGKRLRDFYLSMARACLNDPPVVRATIRTGVVNPVRSMGFLELYYTQFDLLRALIAEGQQRGEITKDYSARQLATFMESLNYSVLSIWAAGILASDDLLAQIGSAVDFFLRRSGR
jgi:AcrR family transcriptional regulator